MDLILARQVLQWGYGRWKQIAVSQFDFLGNGHPITFEAFCRSIGIVREALEQFFMDRMEVIFSFLAAFAPENE
jgi:hypothetical protein